MRIGIFEKPLLGEDFTGCGGGVLFCAFCCEGAGAGGRRCRLLGERLTLAVGIRAVFGVV